MSAACSDDELGVWLAKLAGIDAFSFSFRHADPAWARLVFLHDFPMTQLSQDKT